MREGKETKLQIYPYHSNNHILNEKELKIVIQYSVFAFLPTREYANDSSSTLYSIVFK